MVYTRDEKRAVIRPRLQVPGFMSKAGVALFVLSVAFFGTSESPQLTPGEEFAGPFPSWANVKAEYGAVADGRADDTSAIQRGLDELGKPGRSPVLFLPAGTYGSRRCWF